MAHNVDRGLPLRRSPVSIGGRSNKQSRRKQPDSLGFSGIFRRRLAKDAGCRTALLEKWSAERIYRQTLHTRSAIGRAGRGSDGTLWIQGSGGLFQMRGSVCQQVGVEHGYPGGFPAAILVGRKGTVWVRTLAGDLIFLRRGPSKFQRLQYAAGAISAAFVLAAPAHNAFLHEAPDGAIWLSDDYGLRRVTDTAGAPVVSFPRSTQRKENIQFGDFTFAPDGSLWAASDKGVRRFDHVERWQSSVATEDSPGESFTTDQGLSSNASWKVLIDRESSIWVGTNAGLDQLRRTTLTALVLP